MEDESWHIYILGDACRLVHKRNPPERVLMDFFDPEIEKVDCEE